MTDESASAGLLGNPLREEARKVRRILLAVCVVGYIVISGDLIPSEISQFGLKFSHVHQGLFIQFLYLILGYHVLMFGFLGLTDYLDQKKRLYLSVQAAANEDLIRVSDAKEQGYFEKSQEHATKVVKPHRFQLLFEPSEKVRILRWEFEFWAPLIAGIIVIIKLMLYDPPTAIDYPVRWD